VVGWGGLGVKDGGEGVTGCLGGAAGWWRNSCAAGAVSWTMGHKGVGVSCWWDCVGHLVIPPFPSWEGDRRSDGGTCGGEAVDLMLVSAWWS
jgi:hypothetical protein